MGHLVPRENLEGTAAIEPEPVITWRGVTSLSGWVFLFAGIFFFVVGCSPLGGLKCTGTLAFRSTLLTILGGLLLGSSLMNWTNGVKLPRMMIAKKVLRKIAGLIVLVIVVLFFLFMSLLVCVGFLAWRPVQWDVQNPPVSSWKGAHWHCDPIADF